MQRRTTVQRRQKQPESVPRVPISKMFRSWDGHRLWEVQFNRSVLPRLNCLFAFLVVLDEKQRKAKRQLINENRERRKLENIRSQIVSEETGHRMSEEDKNLIHEITKAFVDTVDVSNYWIERLDGWPVGFSAGNDYAPRIKSATGCYHSLSHQDYLIRQKTPRFFPGTAWYDKYKDLERRQI